MANQELRDKSNKLLGKIKTVSGKLELRDATNKLKGKYDPKTNQTRDDRNRLVGKGNPFNYITLKIDKFDRNITLK